MIPPEKRKSAGRTEVVLFVLLLVAGLLLVRLVAGDSPLVSREAVVRAGVGRDLLDGETRGRQGLVGSLYWSPLPTLLALPLLSISPSGEWGHMFVAVASGALLCAFLCAWLRRAGLGVATRATASAAVFLSPALQRPMMTGSSAPLFALVTTCALCFLIHWWETDQLRSLAYLGIVLALAMATRYQAAVLLTGATVFVLTRLALRRHGWARTEATLIVFLLPGLYVAGLWLAANWLIMGDPGFFLRGLPGRGETWAAWAVLLFEGCEWEPVLILWAVALVGWAVGALLSRRRTLWTAVPVLAACLLLWTGHYRTFDLRESDTDAELPRVLADLRMTHRGDWIVVSGYRGYESRSAGVRLHHTMSFYLDQVLERTREKRAYLLVPAPEGRDRWEDINLRFERKAFENGTAFTVFEKTWRHWRLWRIIRMDETDRR